MGLLRNRPLFGCCAAFAGAAAIGLWLFGESGLYGYIGVAPRILLLSVLAFLSITAICMAVLALCAKRDSSWRPRLITAAVSLLLAAVALGQSYTTFAGTQAQALKQLEHKTVAVTGTVTDRRGAGGYLTSFALELDTVNRREVHGTALLTCHYTSNLRSGQAVALSATLLPLSEAAGDGYDGTALAGDGYVIGLVSEDEREVRVTAESAPMWPSLAGTVRHTLAARLNNLADGAYGLPSALLLGDRSALDLSVRRDFSRAGVAHLLAISGLHMTLLFGLLERFFALLRMPRRVRAVLLCIAALGYLTFLGFPPSATRAVIMLGMVYLSTILSVRADPLTSLGVACLTILAVSPHAAADVGFWMSALATLGLVTVMPLITQAGTLPAKSFWSKLKTALIRIAVALSVGVVAMTFTLFLTAVAIGELGVLSPISTLLLTPLCAVVLILSLAALPLFGTPAGLALGSSIEAVSGLMARAAAWMAEPNRAVVSLRHPAILPVAVGMVALTGLFLIIRLPRRRQWTVLLPMLAGWIAVSGIVAADTMARQAQPTAAFLQPSSRSDALVVTAGQASLICDLSDGSLTAMNAAMREAECQGATELSVLMLTHYHSRTAGTLSTFLAREKVRALWLPTPATAEDYYLLLAYTEKAEAAGVPVTVYEMGAPLTVFGNACITVETASLPRSTQPVLLVTLDTRPAAEGIGELVYAGSAIPESTLADTAAARIGMANVVIFGNHGPLPKAAFGQELHLRPSTTVILSAEGDVAGYLSADSFPGSTALWWGQKRFLVP